MVAPGDRAKKLAEAATLPKVLMTDIDINWLQVIGEGWASPLKGFMREGPLLQALHFNSLLIDTWNVTGATSRPPTGTITSPVAASACLSPSPSSSPSPVSR